MAPSRLARTHIEAERRLRAIVTGQVGRIWRSLPGYDRENVDEWISRMVPIVVAGERQSVALTDAYLARALRRAPLGVDLDALQIRNGVSPETAYERPFVTVWSALSAGTAFADAVSSGLSRATGMAAFDVQAAMRDTAQVVGAEDPQIQRYQRVADGGACEFCLEVDGAILNSDDAMPLHNHCGCGIEPLTEARPVSPPPEGLEQHGELGPVLTAPEHSFTSL